MILQDVLRLSGIYKLTNKINKKNYIGKAKDLFDRLSRHSRSKKKSNVLAIH